MFAGLEVDARIVQAVRVSIFVLATEEVSVRGQPEQKSSLGMGMIEAEWGAGRMLLEQHRVTCCLLRGEREVDACGTQVVHHQRSSPTSDPDELEPPLLNMPAELRKRMRAACETC